MKWFLSSLIFAMSFILIFFGVSTFEAYKHPLKYEEIIMSNAEKYEIDAKLIASIINVESGFSSNVVSNKGAIGLMQILPSTANWVGEKIGLQFDDAKLFEPSVNIEIGSYYISYLASIFDNEDLVICAYNAGLGNVKKWLQDSQYSSDGVSLKNIPFKETQNYLEKVKKELKVYANKF